MLGIVFLANAIGGRYEAFLIPFTYFALSTNPNSFVEIVLVSTANFEKRYDVHLVTARYNAIYDLRQPMPAIYAELRRVYGRETYPTPYPKPWYAKQTASSRKGLNAIVNFVQAKYHRAVVENADDA